MDNYLASTAVFAVGMAIAVMFWLGERRARLAAESALAVAMKNQKRKRRTRAEIESEKREEEQHG
jgi:hypothetical protein